MIAGQDNAVVEFMAAWRSGKMHHAWLLTGPKGVGKATFARAAAARVLAEAAGPCPEGEGIDVPAAHRISHLLEAGSHPDFKLLERVLNKTGSALARNISVDQIRSLGEIFTVTPALSEWRVVIIDSADELEASAANALLKMLEEPPANCLFLLVSHVPGRLLPTIRSRCRLLEFQSLTDDVMASELPSVVPGISPAQCDAVIAAAQGSLGRAAAFAALDLEPLHSEVVAIMRQGDPINIRRSKLAQSLANKASAERYAAFLELVPGWIAQEARLLQGAQRLAALNAYAEARTTSRLAPRLTLDAAVTAFRIGSILASIAPRGERG
jgi:DNA polymerase-3 subunit delta'